MRCLCSFFSFVDEAGSACNAMSAGIGYAPTANASSITGCCLPLLAVGLVARLGSMRMQAETYLKTFYGVISYHITGWS